MSERDLKWCCGRPWSEPCAASCDEPASVIVIDERSFDALSDAIANPRPPTPALVELFKIPRCTRCGRGVSKSMGCKDEPPTCNAGRR